MVISITKQEERLIQIIQKASLSLGYDAYLVGGFVRDRILGRETKDIDVVCVGSGVALAEQVAQLLTTVQNVHYYKRFGTAMLRWEDMDVEFVGARKESYHFESRKPVVEDGTLQDDQNRRDFTINALAASLQEHNYLQVVDPFNGLEDLKKGIIRTPLEPAKTFSDDPLRMMRAIRFATQLQFYIEENTFESIYKERKRIDIISAERITDELNKIILSDQPSIGFELLYESELLDIIFPEMVALQGVDERNGWSHKDNFYHTLEVLDNVSAMTDDLWIRWSAILHDIAKPPTKRFDVKAGWTFHGHDALGAKMVPTIFKRFRLPLDHKMKFVQKLVRLHLRPIGLTKENISDSALRRLLSVSYTHLRAHETKANLVCRLLLEKKKKQPTQHKNLNTIVLSQYDYHSALNRATSSSLYVVKHACKSTPTPVTCRIN